MDNIIKQRDLLMKEFPHTGFVVTNKIGCGLNGVLVIDNDEMSAWKINTSSSPLDALRKTVSHDELLNKMLPWILQTKDMTEIDLV